MIITKFIKYFTNLVPFQTCNNICQKSQDGNQPEQIATIRMSLYHSIEHANF